VGFGIEGEVGVPLFGEGEALDGLGDGTFMIDCAKGRSHLLGTILVVRARREDRCGR
jgi:hypothetical protein